MTNDKSTHGGSVLFPASEHHLLERILAPENLQTAWKQVRRNEGAPGVDGITIEEYAQWVRPRWEKQRRALLEGYYKPQPVKRVSIPKPSGGERHLGIPTVHDRVIQQAIAQVLSAQFDPAFSESSFGFRPKRSAHDAVRHVQAFINEGHRVAVDVDLSKFFDRVSHDILMARVSRRVSDKRVLKLIGKYLRAGVVIDGHTHPTQLGVPQGGPLSPLLANIVLDDLDKYLEQRDLKFARYADDFVICVKSTSRGYRVKEQVTRFLERTLKLQVNEEKSSVVKTNDLNYLGFTFKGSKIHWSADSLAAFKYRVRQLTKRSWGVSMARRLGELRRYVQGWMAYYGLSEYYRPLPGLDQWLRRRVRMCYLKQWRKPRTRIRNLLSLGVPKRSAISIGLSSKGPYRLAKTFAVNQGLSNKYLKRQGLVSIKELWVKFHYPNR